MSVAYDLEDAILSYAQAKVPVGFTFKKLDGTLRLVAPTSRVLYKNNALRFFDAAKQEWRSASDGSILSIIVNGIEYRDTKNLPGL